jgi:hypothetical protein
VSHTNTWRRCDTEVHQERKRSQRLSRSSRAAESTTHLGRAVRLHEGRPVSAEAESKQGEEQRVRKDPHTSLGQPPGAHNRPPGHQGGSFDAGNAPGDAVRGVCAGSRVSATRTRHKEDVGQRRPGLQTVVRGSSVQHVVAKRLQDLLGPYGCVSRPGAARRHKVFPCYGESRVSERERDAPRAGAALPWRLLSQRRSGVAERLRLRRRTGPGEVTGRQLCDCAPPHPLQPRHLNAEPQPRRR